LTFTEQSANEERQEVALNDKQLNNTIEESGKQERTSLRQINKARQLRLMPLIFAELVLCLSVFAQPQKKIDIH
jgi:hypothetical protein